MRTNILIVDDDPAVLDALRLDLEREHEVTTATNAARALELLESKPAGSFHVVVTDMRMPDDGNEEDPEAGLKVVRAARRHDSLIQIIVLTGYDEVGNAVKSMQAGAFTYVGKGAEQEDSDLLKLQIARAARYRARLQASKEAFRMVEIAQERMRGVVAQAEDCAALLGTFVREWSVRLPDVNVTIDESAPETTASGDDYHGE
jgi:DNA-binding NtrC family response regulator